MRVEAGGLNVWRFFKLILIDPWFVGLGLGLRVKAATSQEI